MGLLSCQQVYDDPRLWLNVVHEVHEMLRGIMHQLYPDFGEKIKDIHCLRCEGEEPFTVYERDTLKPKLCTGYIDGEEPLLFLQED